MVRTTVTMPVSPSPSERVESATLDHASAAVRERESPLTDPSELRRAGSKSMYCERGIFSDPLTGCVLRVRMLFLWCSIANRRSDGEGVWDGW